MITKLRCLIFGHNYVKSQVSYFLQTRICSRCDKEQIYNLITKHWEDKKW